jgi:hypothetical protein
MVHHIAQLVFAAALNRILVTKYTIYGSPQGLAAIYYEQSFTLRINASRYKIFQQFLNYCRILRSSVDKTQYMLKTLRIDPYGGNYVMFGKPYGVGPTALLTIRY